MRLRLKDMRRDAELYARQGDKILLIWLARTGRLDRRLQRLVADILDGTLKLKRGRPRTIVKKEVRTMEIGDYVRALPPHMTWKERRECAAKKFKVSEGTVRSALKQSANYAPLGDLGARYRHDRSCK
jgi:hypothetical protein